MFPTLIRIVAELQGRTDRAGLFVAAIIVANICLVLATMALAALVRLDLGPDDARRSVWYLLVFPTSLFLSAGYSESLFLLLTVGAILACRTDRWLWAAALAVLAAVTRPVGLVICVPLAVEAFLAWRASGDWRWRPVVAVVAPLIGLGAWMLFLDADVPRPTGLRPRPEGLGPVPGAALGHVLPFLRWPADPGERAALPDRPHLHDLRHRRWRCWRGDGCARHMRCT